MAFRDSWHSALVYFGLAEEYHDDPEDAPHEAQIEDRYRDRPNVRRLRRRRLHGLPLGAAAGGAGARAPRTDGAVERLYRRTLGRLSRLGWPRRPNETPHEYAARLRAAGPFAGDDAFDGLTARYAAARFGGQQPADDAIAALGRTIGDVLSGSHQN